MTQIDTKAELPTQDKLESSLPTQNTNPEVNTQGTEEPIKDIAEYSTVDVGKALTLRLKHNLSYGAIAKQLNCSKSGVHKRLKPFETLIKDPEALTAYDDNRAALLNSAEMAMLIEMVDGGKLKSASVNNLAYAYKTLFEARRTTKGEHIGIHEYHTVTAKLSELDKEEAELRRELEGN